MINQQQLYEYLKQFDLVYAKKVTAKRTYELSEEVRLRQQAPDEMIFEVDSENHHYVAKRIRTLTKRLQANGYSFAIFDHKGKSPHVHVYGIRGLKDMNIELQKHYKKKMLNKYLPDSDPSFTKSLQLVALELKPHFKHNTIKDCLYVNKGDSLFDNFLEVELLNKAQGWLNRTKQLQHFDEKMLENNWLIECVVNEFNEYKHMMDLILFKNIAIDIVNRGLPPEKIIEQIVEALNTTKVIGQIWGWINWAKEQPRHINHKELQKFFELYEIDYSDVKNKWVEHLKKS